MASLTTFRFSLTRITRAGLLEKGIVRPLKGSLVPLRNPPVQKAAQSEGGAFGDLQAPELFHNPPDLPGADTVYDHLKQRQKEGLFEPGQKLQLFRVQASAPHLGDPD